ncbi:hypothetical protein ABH940_005569 [Streptacidiphilus sp. BW17]|uniref:DnaB-like helicase N-terminal domain-containing protein n=1 Tax=Streptacidiphilus sp. BW17 TaxID=3156274 RepID=UPI0035157453
MATVSTSASPELMAEQALLGALLLNAPAVEMVGSWLHPGHFYRPVHGELFGLLLARQRAGHPATTPGASAADRTEWAMGTIDQARSVRGFTPSYGHTLIASCPHAAHARAYAALVLDSAVRREVTEHATRLANSAAAGHHADVVELVPALQRTVERCFAVWSAATADVQTPACAATWTTPKPSTAPVAEQALAEEATLLGVLMAQPRALPSLAGQLLPGDFAGPLHRVVYEAMVDLSERAQPIDALTVLWQARAGSPPVPDVDLAQVWTLVSDPLPGDPGYWAERVVIASVLRTTQDCAEQLRALAAAPGRPVSFVLGDAERLLSHLRAAADRIQVERAVPPGPAATSAPRRPAAAPAADGRRAPPHGAKEDTHSPPASHTRPAEPTATGRRRR